MRWLFYVSIFAVLMLLSVFVIDQRESGGSLDSIRGNFSGQMNDNLIQNISSMVPYKDPYQSDLEFKDGLFNILNAFFVATILVINTIIGWFLPYAWKYIGADIVTPLAKFLFFVLGTWLFFKAIKPFAIFYVLIDEHYRKKGIEDGQWWKILAAIACTLLLGVVIIVALGVIL